MEPERCAECGFDGTRLTIGDAVVALQMMGPRWRERFAGNSDERLRTRPSPEVWSPLEYAAHTRDVLRMHHLGIAMLLEGQDLTIPAIAPDPPGTDHGYNAQQPDTVLDELETVSRDLAVIAAPAPAEAWNRTATIDGVEHEAGYLLRHAVHDASHHLMDIERDLGGR